MKELIIFRENHIKKIALIEDEELVEKYEENEEDKSIEGNIYVGKVQNVITGLQSAFVDIGEKRTAFIHSKDIMPKVDITKNEKVDNTPINKLIRPGDPIIVEVKREAVDKKGPRLSTHINLSSRFVVLMPNATFITVSQKIEEEEERERLKNIAKRYLPEDMGAIIRTANLCGAHGVISGEPRLGKERAALPRQRFPQTRVRGYASGAQQRQTWPARLGLLGSP